MKQFIYPSPGSFNDFRARNPELDTSASLAGLSVEMSLWRATGEDIDRDKVRLTPQEESLRHDLLRAQSMGEEVHRLMEWPSVGGYEIPPAVIGTSVA